MVEKVKSMFFPKMRPGTITGQSLQLLATFLGVAMVAIDGAVFSGPLFRDGNRVFLLHAEQQPDGETADLRFVDIGDRAASAVIDQKQQIDALTQHIQEQRRVLSENAQTIANLSSAFEGAEKREAAALQDCETYRGRIESLEGTNASLLRSCESLQTTVSHWETNFEVQGALLQQYIDAVGPLDPPPNINDDVQLVLKAIEEEQKTETVMLSEVVEPTGTSNVPFFVPGAPPPPPPPPVVSEADRLFNLEMARRKIGEVVADGSLMPNLTNAENTIFREGSVVDNPFRRLMFLTRGDL
jgi:hypothetical protein